MLVEGELLSVTIAGRDVLRHESVRCEPGSMTALVGPSGCGKTTLLNCLGLLLPADSGHLRHDGVDVTGISGAAKRRFWRDHAAFVLQDFGIMDQESVAFNVTMRSARWGRRSDAALTKALEATGLEGRHDESAGHLSGGEKQRLALARAMYKDAAALFVDEPTASLDADSRRKVVSLLSLLARRGCTVVISTHDAELVEACDVLHRVGAGADLAGVAADEGRR